MTQSTMANAVDRAMRGLSKWVPLSGKVVTVLGDDDMTGLDDGDSHRLSAARGPYFLCDRRVVEDRWLVERFVVPPESHPGNPLIVREHPWEGTGPHIGGSVLRDRSTGCFRMWYSVWDKHAYYNRLPFSYNVCYAESDEGIVWRKPSLGVFDHKGDAGNNCIRLGTDKTQNIDVCFNPKPDTYPGKYIAIHNQKGGVYVSYSDDGKIFTRLFEEPAIAYHSDTHNNFVYDEVRDRWLLFCRPRAFAGYHRRRVALQTSHDLQHWTHERTILVPTENEVPEYYGMTVFRRGDLFFGVVQIYDKDTGLIHGELAWSDDGQSWDFLPTHPTFIARGSEGEWDAGMVMVAESPIDVGDQMWFYYGGFALQHNETERENVCSIGLMIAQRNRLIGVRPRGDQPGFVLTRPFNVAGQSLTVNAAVSGSVAAEARDDGNKAIKGWSFEECDPLTESSFAAEVTWKRRSLAELGEAEVRIIFKLENASLFTFDLTLPPS